MCTLKLARYGSDGNGYWPGGCCRAVPTYAKTMGCLFLVNAQIMCAGSVPEKVESCG